MLDVGVDVLSRNIHAHPKAWAEPAAQIRGGVTRTVRICTQRRAMYVGRALADVVDDPAWGDDAGLQSAQTLEDLHALLVFQRRELLSVDDHLVHAIGRRQIQHEAADRDILVVANRSVVVTHGGIGTHQFAERARLAVIKLIACDHGDCGGRVMQGCVAEAAKRIDLRRVAKIAALRDSRYLHGVQRRAFCRGLHAILHGSWR